MHDLANHYGVIGRADLINLIKFVVYYSQISLVSLINHISLVGSIGFSGTSGLASQISLVSLSGFIGHASFIGLSIISFLGLSLFSLGGLIGHFSLVGHCIIGLINLSASSNHWPIGLNGVISLGLIALSVSTASLACRLISFVSLVGSSTHRLFCERLTTTVIEATKITWQHKQAAALGVATLQSSATKTAASTYNFTALLLHVHLLVGEKMWWWLALTKKKMWLWIASFGNPYNGDMLQYATPFF